MLGLVLWGPPAHSASETQKPVRSPAIQVNVDLTLVTVTVTDRDGRIISGLTANNLQVWEDKVEQKIEYFSAEDGPATTGLVVDISSSMDTQSPLARQAASTCLRAGNSGDEYFLVEFDSQPRVVEDFTTDVGRLEQAVYSTKPKGSTALLDSVHLALEKLKSVHQTRKALLLISDGLDNTSRSGFRDTVEYVKEQDARIYAIGTVPDRYSRQTMMHRTGAETLATLTEAAGGEAFFPRSTMELPGICKNIADDLRNQYVIGYRSTNPVADGKWRKIRIKVNPPQGMSNVVVRAKSGYYAPRIKPAP